MTETTAILEGTAPPTSAQPCLADSALRLPPRPRAAMLLWTGDLPLERTCLEPVPHRTVLDSQRAVYKGYSKQNGQLIVKACFAAPKELQDESALTLHALPRTSDGYLVIAVTNASPAERQAVALDGETVCASGNRTPHLGARLEGHLFQQVRFTRADAELNRFLIYSAVQQARLQSIISYRQSQTALGCLLPLVTTLSGYELFPRDAVDCTGKPKYSMLGFLRDEPLKLAETVAAERINGYPLHPVLAEMLAARANSA